MKKTFFLLLVFTFVSIGFSQENNTKKEKIIALLEMNSNSKIFTELVTLNIQEIDKNKQEEFRNKIAELEEKKKEEAIIYFLKKYSEKDINAIYADYSVPNRMAYTQKTLSFLREWKTFKMLFQKEFKEVFMSF